MATISKSNKKYNNMATKWAAKNFKVSTRFVHMSINGERSSELAQQIAKAYASKCEQLNKALLEKI